jgi:hypothetical protein
VTVRSSAYASRLDGIDNCSKALLTDQAITSPWGIGGLVPMLLSSVGYLAAGIIAFGMGERVAKRRGTPRPLLTRNRGTRAPTTTAPRARSADDYSAAAADSSPGRSRMRTLP